MCIHSVCRVGAILGIVSVQQLSTNIGHFQTTVDNALDDLSNYLDGGAKVSIQCYMHRI